MSARPKSIYVCSECGGQSPKWQGQCPHCGGWNALVETVAEKPGLHRYGAVAAAANLRPLARISAKESPRMSTGVGELDRALGGG
ncbi:MAG TPA: DNA repair protein RadA, partial [Burkholderiales bacterium]|nr:DNA repair protein RadA [Burkholderiales bacterium]